jgi:diguanylate cyclase (GGDEF)-like protein
MDSTIWIIIVCGLLLLVLLLVWKTKIVQKKVSYLANELQFFKKEKEYYDELMILFSNEYKVVFANKAAKTLFSLEENNNLSDNIKLQINSGKRENFVNTLERLSLEHQDSFKLENIFLYVGQKETKVNIFIDKSNWNINQTITCIIDLDVKQHNIELSNVNKNNDASIDLLTGLPNQFKALSDINTLVMESQKKSKSFTILLLGIDHFIDIQTTLGLGYTNTILKKVSQNFIDNLDESMKVYYMESDKFLFLIDSLDNDESAHRMAKELIVSASQSYEEEGDTRLTNSVGIVLYPDSGKNATKLINNVYAALAKAQSESESGIVIFHEEDTIVHIDEIQMNEDIRKGLIKGEFLLYYQPIFDLKGESIIGAEALLRWKHPKHGLISADKFIDIAEKTGLIIDLGEYVFNEAIQECERCNIGRKKEFQITVNLSLKEMSIENLIPRLEVLFDKYNVKRSMINLDIGESIAIENIDKISKDFKLLKEFGLSLTLEHFGAKYSSFKYLNLLPIDTIKIDRSLIFDVTLNLKHQTTVKAIIDLGHTLGYKVIAEGIETSQEAGILDALKCDYAQGYLYAKPLPYLEFEALIKI